jgi:hypothetical protein
MPEMMVRSGKAVEFCGKITIPALSQRQHALGFFHGEELVQRNSFSAKK